MVIAATLKLRVDSKGLDCQAKEFRLYFLTRVSSNRDSEIYILTSFQDDSYAKLSRLIR